MRNTWAFAILTCALLICYSPAAAAPAAQGGICFPGVPGIEQCIAPQFASYWQGNGGLPVFGYPLGPRALGAPEAGAAQIAMQWTERNRLEAHPDAPPDYRVQLGRVGAERLAQLGRDPSAEPAEGGPIDGCLWFAETRHTVCDQGDGLGFRSYWERHGLTIGGLSAYQRSLALFGLPLTAAQLEPSADGEPVITQWFERARFEWHPDKPAEFRVLLGRLGSELRGPDTGTVTAPTSFGVEINRGAVAGVAGRLGELGVTQVRYNGILWAEVEPTKGERRWENLASVEGELSAISAAGAAPTVIVRSAPTWARQVPGSACGPIRADALPDFAAFMGEVVARYSQPPYNVHRWELGNEPDIDPNLVAGGSPFGCWGDAGRADYGGAGYAAMLKAAYPAIKAADPQAQVILGGLLLFCDPGEPAAAPCLPGRFFEGVLQAGGGDYLDVVAYHAYTYWDTKGMDWDLQSPGWARRGGITLGKLQLLREVMRRYAVDKPVLMNEGGLLCYRSDPSCGPGGFYADQANYMARLYARAAAGGLEGAVWFTLNGPGWQEGGLLDAAQQPRPAFQTLAFLSRLLGGATYVSGEVAGGVERHSFRKGDRSYTICWTNDGSDVEIPLPAGARTVYTLDGASAPAGARLRVGSEPQIVEMADS
ncbi:hypothetical protein K2Z83_24260 [Oscillochloris sp. ZM17-4]|uniref:hypothetical protein n=1 Tax=Oscillochloris sp. ZM17-4 TaxID=2866714 RepID=UPI001C7371AB|nr:hypothetical protein [Oscillochloris sp. ZM17-4]MBX0330775.1 hypothetical protein [Oscillochloris sp. ZM17-4]